MMSQAATNRADATGSDAALPKSEIRTTVSFLLFLHFFALAVAIVSSERASQLTAALAQVPGIKQYREGLLNITPYTFYFTRGTIGGELDVDHSLIATVQTKDGEKVVQLPEPGMWPGQRLHRYQTLARNVAIFGDETMGMPDPERLGLLVQSISKSILEEQHGQSLQLRCVGRLTLPAMAEFDPDNESQRVRYRDAYTASAFIMDNNRVELIKKEPARDTAPPPKDTGPSQTDTAPPPQDK
jgi:hypothetical protein